MLRNYFSDSSPILVGLLGTFILFRRNGPLFVLFRRLVGKAIAFFEPAI